MIILFRIKPQIFTLVSDLLEAGVPPKLRTFVRVEQQFSHSLGRSPGFTHMTHLSILSNGMMKPPTHGPILGGGHSILGLKGFCSPSLRRQLTGLWSRSTSQNFIPRAGNPPHVTDPKQLKLSGLQLPT